MVCPEIHHQVKPFAIGIKKPMIIKSHCLKLKGCNAQAENQNGIISAALGGRNDADNPIKKALLNEVVRFDSCVFNWNSSRTA